VIQENEMFVVFDLDGTLANTDHRSHLVDRANGKPDWRAFYAACDMDEPHEHVMDVLGALVGAGHDVEIWSGRSDEVRDKTEAWLLSHGLDSYQLRMRKEGDYTPDDILKRAWLDECIAADRKPDLFFDDRSKVVAMWRGAGIPCFQVAPGDF
jgi:phosphoglycolate phosphatase-like HAD superfamily hydrolase